jgi:hypothetical protein
VKSKAWRAPPRLRYRSVADLGDFEPEEPHSDGLVRDFLRVLHQGGAALRRQGGARAGLERLGQHGDPSDYREALDWLCAKQVDLARVLAVLQAALEAERRHQRAPRRLDVARSFYGKRRRTRAALITALKAATKLYEETYDDPKDLTIYCQCRDLLVELQLPARLENADPLLTAPSEPDPKLRKATRGPRIRPHVAAARTQLRTLGVPAAHVTELLRGVGLAKLISPRPKK